MAIENGDRERRLFVLDTNVLMHDPTALFRFQEHDLFLPMVVLAELDRGKKGMSEVARNVRQATRFLDDILAGASKEAIAQGLPIRSTREHDGNMQPATGRLYFGTSEIMTGYAHGFPATTDDSILATAQRLQERFPERNVVVVSKDIILRIKAMVQGIAVEDYSSDKVLDDLNLLYTGMHVLPEDFWGTGGEVVTSTEEGRTYYRMSGFGAQDWYVNQCLCIEGDDAFEGIVRDVRNGEVLVELAHNYRAHRHNVWGINARNREQNFALNMLMDPEVDFVTLLGTAGTGKTLLALAAGLAQVLDRNIYREIIMTRVTVPMGEDIGFLPGTEEEKMTPWMGALMDNLEVLTQTEGGEWGRAATNDLLRNRIRIQSLNYMRGRTFLHKYIILDEAQNLTAKQMKALITRAGPGTKIVCMGNISQIDTPYLTESTSGLTYVVDRFKGFPHGGHITLVKGERSRLADFASEEL